jgi:hypothetical protein
VVEGALEGVGVHGGRFGDLTLWGLRRMQGIKKARPVGRAEGNPS